MTTNHRQTEECIETRCDMHVHSRGSNNVIPLRFTKIFGVRESYSSPEDIYKIAKGRDEKYKIDPPMDFVTITDHNSIEESLRLTYLYPDDTFTGCEYAVKVPLKKGTLLMFSAII